MISPRKIRFIGGGLRYCKGNGSELKDRGITQVSINMTDYTRTALYRAFELVRVASAATASALWAVRLSVWCRWRP